ncbi:MAG: choice-of-anchor Q domain-containing protein [Myxococcota bacterium]
MMNRRPTTFYLVLALYLALLASSARAAGVVGTGSPASCTDAALASALVGGGLVTFNCGPGNVVIPVNTHVIATGEATIVDGANGITLDGEDSRQHFYVLNGASLHLRRIVLQHGRSTAGGAILNQGSLLVESARLISNVAEAFGSGGAIYNDSASQLTVQDSTFRSNVAQAGGGAIQNLGHVDVTTSLFELNSAGLDGGAIQNNGGDARIDRSTLSVNAATNGAGIELNGGTFRVRRSTLIGNGAFGQGGGIRNVSGTLTVENATFVGNEANTGGGIYTEDAVSLLNSTLHLNKAFAGGALWRLTPSPVTAQNTIFSFSLEPGSVAAQLNCDGGQPLVSTGNNLSTDNSCNLNLASDQPATDPLLGPIANNGGPTQTHLPLAGSPAIDRGSNVGCPTTDQRGAVRPLSGGLGVTCDIGAVEVPEPATGVALAGGVLGLASLRGKRRVARRRS